MQGRKVAMLDAKAASDIGWETAAKRADAMEKLVDRNVFNARAPLESRPDRRAGSTGLSSFSTSGLSQSKRY